MFGSRRRSIPLSTRIENQKLKTNNWNSDKRKGEPPFHFLTGKICRLDTYFGTWNPFANTARARRSALHGYAPKQNTRYFSLPSCQGRSLSLPKNNVCSVHPGSLHFPTQTLLANPAANFAVLYQVPFNLPLPFKYQKPLCQQDDGAPISPPSKLNSWTGRNSIRKHTHANVLSHVCSLARKSRQNFVR